MRCHAGTLNTQLLQYIYVRLGTRVSTPRTGRRTVRGTVREAGREPSGSTPSELEENSAAPQQSADSLSNARVEAALERRLANGRESQRRFRERQKVVETNRSAVVAVE